MPQPTPQYEHTVLTVESGTGANTRNGLLRTGCTVRCRRYIYCTTEFRPR
jgi:hypothetical protein